MLNKLSDRIDSISISIGMVVVVIMCVAIFLQVVFRYLLSDALGWSEEVGKFCFLIATYCGMIVCMSKEKHLRVNLIEYFISKRQSNYLDMICMVINVIFFIVTAYLCFQMTIEVYETEQTAVAFPLPLWTVWAFIPLACVAIVIQAIKAFFSIKRRNDELKGEK